MYRAAIAGFLLGLALLSAPGQAQTFSDVTVEYWAYEAIEVLSARGITGGCGDDKYCPEDFVTRAQMAVFLERSLKGSGFAPPPATGTVFVDVEAGDFAAAFIEQLYLDGITGGCGSNEYCPDDSVSRAQMAVFLLRAIYGPGHTPPSPSGIFDDVDLSHWAVSWIEQLAAEGITSGCGNGIYCPEDSVTRAQMAVFLVRAFDLDASTARLKSLGLSSGALEPAFSPNTYSYEVTTNATDITITPIALNPADRIEVNGITIDSGQTTPALPMTLGLNSFSVNLTSADGEVSNTYELQVYRQDTESRLASLSVSAGALTPSFEPSTRTYHLAVTYETTSTTVTATPLSDTANVRLNGTTFGNTSADTFLNVGENPLTVEVTAEDGVTTNVYTVAVYRLSADSAGVTSIGDGSGLTAEEIEKLGQFEASVTSVSMSSRPVVEFAVTDQNGDPALGIAGNVIGFTLAKLVPGDPGVNGGIPYWQSYINSTETADAGNSPNVLPSAVQATTDTEGLFEDLGAGRYRYTFATEVTAVTDPIGVEYEPGLTHRLGLELDLSGADLSRLSPANPVFDFVPDGGIGSGVSKTIATAANCTTCHSEVSAHGGIRKAIVYCVTCHNPGTVDQDTGESLDMAYMTHSIHAGKDRVDGESNPLPYIVHGDEESRHDYGAVTYPQSRTYCETCHAESLATPDGNAWNLGASVQTCASCHADGLVVGNFDAISGIAEYQFDHSNSDIPAVGIQPADTCATCHLGAITGAGPAELIHSTISGDQKFREILGSDFIFEILNAINLGPGETPIITFRILDADGNPYDILNDPSFTDIQASMNLFVAWPGTETYNGDELGSTGGLRERGNGPEYYGAGLPHRLYLSQIQQAIVDQGVSQAADGSYTLAYFTALPTDFAGEAYVAMSGHPVAVDVADADGNVLNHRAAASSVVYYPGVQRQPNVSSEKCMACHQQLQAHGATHNANVEQCIVCHTPDLASDKSGFDEGFALGYMIHSIHAASPSYLEGAFSGSTYPQTIANCLTCHLDGTFAVARPEARAVSVAVGSSDETMWTDDLATTPTAAACGTCHATAADLGHFATNNGQIGVKKGDILLFDGLPNGQEACAVCHAPGSEFDTSLYHDSAIQ